MAIQIVEQGSAESFRKTINDNFSSLKDSFESINTDISGIEGKITNIESNIDSIESNIDLIETKITNIEGDISKVEVLSGNGPPSTSTKGSLGQTYLDTRSQRIYQCVKISGSTYTWISSSSGSITISEEQPNYPNKGDMWFQII